MNKLSLITCLFVLLGAALAASPAANPAANPATRESRQTQIELEGGLVWMDDDMINPRTIFTEEIANPTMVSTRNVGATPAVTTDQQPEEQRYPYGRPYGFGYGYGYGFGRPYGYGGGRPWGPYGRPWGPYSPYRPWGPF